ncbi:MAG: serine/threonine-protein kinase [Gemmataceae bacterium]
MTNLEAIFFAALDKEDAIERAAFLDSACAGDAELRRLVEKLLSAHPKMGEFLKKPIGEQLSVSPSDETQALSASTDEAATGAHPKDEAPNKDEPLSFLEPSTRPDSLGRLGHYEMLQVLGQGGFGIVFRAFDETLQRVVALKVLAPAIAATSPARKRFLREARSSAKVRHENVVQVYAVEEQPLPYLAMEFIPGETLQQRLDRTGPLDAPEIVRLGRQIAEGLAAAHATGLVHRDIKPGNVLIEAGPQERVKITDFGLARAADDASLTQSGVLSGTPMYMAAEQAKGDAIDHRADLFSLGSVLYVMVTGRPPFRASTTFGVLKRVAEGTPRSIQEIIPEAPQWLSDVIAKLHAKNPDERFQTAREVADVLADCEARIKTDPNGADFSRVPHNKPAKGRWKWLVAAGVLLPILVLALTEATGLTHLLRHGQPTPEIPRGGHTELKRPDPTRIGPTKLEEPRNDKDPASKAHEPWAVLKPIEMKSEGEATLTLQDDNSVLVSGKEAPNDVYTLTFRAVPAVIHGLRLEVLPHSSLPENGPGRASNGEFVLTTIKARLDPRTKTDEARVLTFTKAWADNSRGDDSLVHLAIDADDNTGWVSEVGQAHYAVFEFAEPVLAAEGATLRVILEFKHEDLQKTLGRFRISAARKKGGERP